MVKKYWFSRYLGHALFSSSLNSIDFLPTINNCLLNESTDKVNLSSLSFLQTKLNNNVCGYTFTCITGSVSGDSLL
jgi:hypothetical protein